MQNATNDARKRVTMTAGTAIYIVLRKYFGSSACSHTCT
jgi:hypothetical protein